MKYLLIITVILSIVVVLLIRWIFSEIDKIIQEIFSERRWLYEKD